MGSAKEDTNAMALEARKRKAVELRREGLTYQEIADSIGVCKATAHNYVHGSLADLAEQRLDATEELVQLELERIDEGIRDLMASRPVVAQALAEGRLDAVKELGALRKHLLNHGESRRKLLGLDAPQRNQHTVVTMSPEDAAEEINDAFGLDCVEVVEVDDEEAAD